MDVLEWLRKQLIEADPDLLREMVKVFAEQLMGAEVDVLCGAGYGGALRRAHEPAQRLSGTSLGHPRRHDRAAGAEAAPGHLLPGLVA